MRIEIKDQKHNDHQIILDLDEHLALEDLSLLKKTEYRFEQPNIIFEEKCIHIDGVYIYFCHKKHALDRYLTVSSSSSYIQMHFELDKGASHYKSNNEDEKEIVTLPGEYSFFFLPKLDGVLYLPKCDQALSVEIELSEKWLKKFFGQDLSLLGEFGKNIISKERAIFANQSLPITSDIMIVLNQLHNSPVEGPLLKVYLESKLLELISLIIHRPCCKTNLDIKRIADQDRLRVVEVKTLIEQNLNFSYSIEYLAAFAGMNRTKLQALFQQLYGKTIHEFVISLRMKVAYSLLSKPGNNLKMQDIANKIGYRHYNHFSIAFKKYYGISPGKI